jgi:hypothetical protein
MTERLFTLSTADSIRAVPASHWDATAGRDNPFLSHAFLSALEESGSVSARTGWDPTHLLLHKGDRLVGCAPCYRKSHSMGEYVFDHAWARAFEQAGGRYYPKLQVSVPFTPATGPRLLVGTTDAEASERRAALAHGLTQLASDARASSVHATFLTEPDRDAFAAAGWLARTDQQFHWINRGYADFEDFLGAFASRKRKQVRRERRDALAAGLTVRHCTGSDLTEAVWDAFFAFYIDTGNRKWGRPYLNRAFFSLISERMADRILLVIAERDGRPIAGALNFIGTNTLYGRNWGALEEHPFLHFELCYYQAIDFALARGLARVEAGAQGEHKLARGYEPVTTHSAHHIVHPGLRRAIADYLEHERAEVARINAALAEATPFKATDDDA